MHIISHVHVRIISWCLLNSDCTANVFHAFFLLNSIATPITHATVHVGLITPFTCTYALGKCVIMLLYCIIELKALVVYITGSYVARKKSILLDFMRSDYGTIIARTCSCLIIFPRGVFCEADGDSAFHKFCMAMNGIIDFNLRGLKFNTT